ncbi:MAG: hypothetical protein II672_05450, partial [Oscillospiraceae bacterium]|nr:hypothetical protein [Oscillospiraceae bacterium]
AGGACFITRVSEENNEWFFSIDNPGGDLYEAEEIFRLKGEVEGTTLQLFRYPSGEKFVPVPKKNGICLENPVMHDGKISILAVDFVRRRITIKGFDCADHTVTVTAEMSLDETEDCYNLMLHEHPLTLTRQPNDGMFHIIWPERISFPIGNRESFYHRDGNELYFSRWFEDPDYREETVIRDVNSGKIVSVFPGSMYVMPDGDKWFLK